MMLVRVFAVGVVLLATATVTPRSEAQRLGRLFTTAEQRAVLDEIRAQAQFTQPELEMEPDPRPQSVSTLATEPLDPVVSKLVVNGIVRRSGGRTSVWVNGDEVERGNSTREGVAVDTAHLRTDVIRLRLPSGTRSIALRPGQEIDVRSGLVLEPYEKSTASSNAPSAFATQPEESAAPTPAATGASEPKASPAPPQSSNSGAGSAQPGVEALPTGSRQSAPGGAMVPDIVQRLREIGKLPAQQAAEALSELSATTATRTAVPPEPQRQ